MSTPTNVNLFVPFNIDSSITDFKARLRPGAIVNMLVEAAIQSADSLGFGFSGLRKDQLFWVLSRISVDIKAQVKWYDKVVLETWPKTIDGLHYIRDFILRNDNGEEILVATSAWLAIDLETKKIRTLSGDLLNTLHRNDSMHALQDPPEKLRPVKEGDTFERTAQYFDLDLNGHVTSARYADFMMDTFDLDFHAKNYPKHISINFLKETMYGNRIKILRAEKEANTFIFEGYNLDRESQAFRGKIVF